MSYHERLSDIVPNISLIPAVINVDEMESIILYLEGNSHFILNLENNQRSQTDAVHYLELTFDRRMTWTDT